MSDLLALQPNIAIRLHLVAPDDRRDKVEQEILRPTFSLRDKPLREVCGFIAFSKLVEQAEGIRRLRIAGSLRPDFLAQTAPARFRLPPMPWWLARSRLLLVFGLLLVVAKWLRQPPVSPSVKRSHNRSHS